MKKAIKIISFTLVALLLLVLILSACVTLFGKYSGKTEIDLDSAIPYQMSEIFKDNGDTLVTDIAMLGSHDSFSNNITAKSKIDPAEKSSYIAFPVVRQITSRFAKAQTQNAYFQAVKGVRYFDVRLSFDQTGTLYTKHALLSEELSENLEKLLSFATKNIGELFVLDFQHVFLNEFTASDLFHEIEEIKFDGKNVFDFVNYDSSKTPLSSLTYDIATANGTTSGFVLLFKDETILENNQNDVYYSSLKEHQNTFYSRDLSIVSTWHNKLSDEDMFDGIDKELARLQSENPMGVFVVNQAQKTPPIAPSNLFLNLLDLADDFNFKHLQRDNFDAQMQAMPIFMVDNATTDANNFNVDVMKYIKNYNINLK